MKVKKFTDMLNTAINKYNKRAIETSKVIEELIELANEVNDPYKACEGSNMIQEEVAFYDALASHYTAEQVLGDDILKVIAHELTKAIKENMIRQKRELIKPLSMLWRILWPHPI